MTERRRGGRDRHTEKEGTINPCTYYVLLSLWYDILIKTNKWVEISNWQHNFCGGQHLNGPANASVISCLFHEVFYIIINQKTDNSSPLVHSHAHTRGHGWLCKRKTCLTVSCYSCSHLCMCGSECMLHVHLYICNSELLCACVCLSVCVHMFKSELLCVCVIQWVSGGG